MRALLAVMLAAQLVTAGCALFASANAAHSHITPCIDEPTYAVVDVVLAAGATAAVVGTEAVDDSVAWMIIPGVFVASALIGGISAHRCKAARQDEATASTTNYGSFVDPHAPPPPPPELPTTTGITPIDPVVAPPIVPAHAHTKLDLELDPDSALGSTIVEPDDAKLACSTSPMVACPEHYSCQLDDRTNGHCVRDR